MGGEIRLSDLCASRVWAALDAPNANRQRGCSVGAVIRTGTRHTSEVRAGPEQASRRADPRCPRPARRAGEPSCRSSGTKRHRLTRAEIRCRPQRRTGPTGRRIIEGGSAAYRKCSSGCRRRHLLLDLAEHRRHINLVQRHADAHRGVCCLRGARSQRVACTPRGHRRQRSHASRPPETPWRPAPCIGIGRRRAVARWSREHGRTPQGFGDRLHPTSLVCSPEPMGWFCTPGCGALLADTELETAIAVCRFDVALGDHRRAAHRGGDDFGAPLAPVDQGFRRSSAIITMMPLGPRR